MSVNLNPNLKYLQQALEIVKDLPVAEKESMGYQAIQDLAEALKEQAERQMQKQAAREIRQINQPQQNQQSEG